METFPFHRQPNLSKKKILALYDSMAFLKDNQNIIWMGGTGCGKTGLATSFLIQAIHQGARGRYVLFADLLYELHRSQADRSQGRLIGKYLRRGRARAGGAFLHPPAKAPQASLDPHHLQPGL
jgi:DNA replication protein DnaC